MANTFLDFPEWRVRGITRNPSSERAQALSAKGVEIVQADFNNKESLYPAFEGATAIFSNTDFFANLQTAMESDVLSSGRTANEHAFDLEVIQGVNIAEAAASPTVIKTLERFVLSSLSEARKWSGGKYTSLWHFDSKAKMIQVIQERFPQLAERMSTLQIGHYVENWKKFSKMAPQKQPDGSYLIERPFGLGLKLPFIVAHRDTGAFVKALIELPPGKDLLGESESMAWPEWMELWGGILGVKAGVKQISKEEFFDGVPTAVKDELWDNYTYCEEFGHTGGDPNVLKPAEMSFTIQLHH